MTNFADDTLGRTVCSETRALRRWLQNVLTLHGIVPSADQTCALMAAQEVHIHLFTFSVYCLRFPGRQRYYFSVEDPRKVGAPRGSVRPQNLLAAVLIQSEKLAHSCRGSRWEVQTAASTLAPFGCRFGMRACHIDLADQQLAKRGNELRVYEKEGATK